MSTPSALALGLLMLGMTTPVAGLQRTAPQKAESPENPTRFVSGAENPDAIPDFLAWKNFYLSVDWQYRMGRGFLYGFINLRLRIGGYLRSDPKAGDAIFQTLVDHAALALRDLEMLDGESRIRQRSLELGGVSEQEFEAQEEEALRERIAMLQRSVESLRSELLRLSPTHGSQIWREIRGYVLSVTKSSMSITSYGDGPSRHEQIMFEEFHTPPADDGAPPRGKPRGPN